MKVMQLLSTLHHNDDERQILLLCRTLVKQGHESVVISSTDADYDLAIRLQRDGSEYEQVYLTKNAWLTLLSVPRLARLIRHHRPDIIHVHSRTPAWVLKWALLLVPPAYHPLTVATIYGYYPTTLYNKAIFDTQHLVSVSDHVTEHIKRHHQEYNDTSITRIYRGVNKQKYIYRHQPSVHWLQQVFAEHPELEHKKWLIFPYRIDYNKGQQWLCDIVGNLKDEYPDLQVLIMDDDNNDNLYYEQFVQRIHALGIEDFFTFIGQYNSTREWLAAADLVVGLANQPESIGIQVLNALHLGTPVVAWNHGIYGEILSELYPQGLVRQINAIALCKAIKNQLTHGSRPKISNHFTAKQTVQDIFELYQSLAALEHPLTASLPPEEIV